MTVLRQGITGFLHLHEPPLPIWERSDFRALCFSAARSIGGQIRAADDCASEIAANYMFEIVDLADGPVAILANRHFPVIGFAIPPRLGDISPLRFVDCANLAEALRANGDYHVLTRAALEGPLSEQEVRQLSPAEIAQVRYWKPTRLGDVVFNHWD